MTVNSKNNVIRTQRDVLILGNGFDLALGLRTSFKDVVRHIIYSYALWNYKNNDELKNKLATNRSFESLAKALKIETSYTESLKLKQEDKVELSADQKYFINTSFHDDNNKLKPINEIVKSKYFNEILYKISPYISYLDTRKNINSYTFIKESHLVILYGLSNYDYTGFVQDHQIDLPNEYRGKGIGTIDYLIRGIDNSNISCWFDFESYIELAVTHDENLKKKYNVDEKSKFLLDGEYNNTKEFRIFVDLFEVVLNNYLQKCNEQLNKDNKHFYITQNYISSLKKRSNGLIENVSLDNMKLVINYNYTTTYKDLFYNANSYYNEIHINGILSSDNDKDIKTDNLNNIVIGFSLDETNQSLLTNFNKDFFSFEKKTRRIIKNVPSLNLKNVLEGFPYNLIVFGHSCCLADSKELKPLFASSLLRVAIVFCYDEETLISCHNNIRYMVGSSRMDELLSKKAHNDYNKSSSLFFALSSEGKSEILNKGNCSEPLLN